MHISLPEFSAAFVGRFQPFHNGHLQAILGILKMEPNLLIIIGSKLESGTVKNPYAYEHRVEVIEHALENAKVDLERVKIVGLADINNDNEWVDYLIDTVPKFRTMYTGSEDTKFLFLENGKVEVANVDFLEGLNATLVRDKLKKSQDISGLVPYDPEILN
jgi:nicotinamide-nucleotide adenylyltransferase